MRLVVPAVLTLALAACQRAPDAPPAPNARPLVLAAAERRLDKIFLNPRARAELAGASAASFAPATPEDAAAALAPKTWRRLDRAHRYGAVLLAGPLGEYQPLLAHLATSPDFRLVALTPAGALFARGGGEPFPVPAAKDQRFDRDRGLSLARLALLLDTVGERRAARDHAEAALEEAPNDPNVRVGVAALAYAQKDYPRAMAEAQQALTLRSKDRGALEVMARTLAVTGNADAAWQVGTELKALAPADDLNVLFLHARLANAARAFSAEQDSLERLIALAEKARLPTSDFRVYLGQCYARQGLARPALEQLELAAKDPNLSSEQRSDLATAIATVRSRAGNFAN